MKRATVLFITGLILFMAGIYVSTIWEVPGMFMGIFGGMIMGSSTYFFVSRQQENQ